MAASFGIDLKTIDKTQLHATGRTRAEIARGTGGIRNVCSNCGAHGEPFRELSAKDCAQDENPISLVRYHISE